MCKKKCAVYNSTFSEGNFGIHRNQSDADMRSDGKTKRCGTEVAHPRKALEPQTIYMEPAVIDEIKQFWAVKKGYNKSDLVEQAVIEFLERREG